MADLIKKIKIKKQDGTFSDYILIGADAEYIDLENGNNLQEEINHITKSYDNIAAMKADETLKAGDICQTLGYYLADDGGEAIYKITNQESQTEHQEQLTNNLYANLIVDSDKINVKQFGTINSENINKAIDYAYSKFGGGIIYIPKQDETIELENYINVKNNCILDMGNNNFEIIENFENKNGFCIGMNTENGSSWDIAYNRGCEIRNANILNNSSTKKCIVTLSTNTIIENIMFTNFENAISKITYYTDSCKISRCMFFYNLNDTPTDYKIRCEFGGDGLLIEQCHFGVGSRIYTPRYNRAIYLYSCRGGNIVDCINGEYNLSNCMGVSISNCHIEVGKVKFDQSISCTLSNTGFFWLPTYQNEAIVIDYNCEVDLKDLTFYLTSDDYSIPQNDYYDVTIRLNSNVHMENITKTYVLSNGEKCITAPKIKEINENNVGYDLNPFNRLSCILYKNYNTGKNVKNLYNVNFSSNDYKVSSLSQGNANFNATSSITYYYNAILYFEEAKKLGYGTHVEQSILNNGKSIILTLSKP